MQGYFIIKAFIMQSLKILDRIKEIARANNQVSFLMEVLIFGKKD